MKNQVKQVINKNVKSNKKLKWWFGKSNLIIRLNIWKDHIYKWYIKRFIYLFHYQNKYLIEINIKSNSIFLGN